MKILVTQGAYKHTLALIRSLAAQGHFVGVVCNSPLDICNWSRFCRRRHFIAQSKGKAFYMAALAEVLEKFSYELLFPVGHPVTGWVSEQRHVLPPGTRLELAGFEQVSLFEDKQKTQALAQSLDIPTPRTFYPDSPESLPAILPDIHFPVVVKHVSEGAPGGVAHVLRPADLERTYRQFVKKYGTPNGKLPMIQEHLPGSGAGFFALYRQGECLQFFMHRRLREFPASGGVSTCAESIEDPEMERLGKKILAAAAWHGLAMVEFKLDAEGKPRLLEINPKLWGSFELSIASGVDFAGKLARMTSSHVRHEPYRKGVIFSWPFNGDLANGLSTGQFFSVLQQNFGKNTFNNLHWGDPVASLHLVARGLLRLPLDAFKP